MKPENALAIFKSKAKIFDQSSSRMDNQTSSHKQDNPKKLKMKPLKPCKLTAIEANIFGEALVANSLTAEVSQYIAKVNERKSCKILAYWSQNKKVYPSLSLMASCYLGIPATAHPPSKSSPN
ncbi:hypothetical protein PGT21_012966 [Puccinia graminis f. sp. tritici]|uniref:HAT C-terminal dimerisation domain-containing protein n=1 Tax=Puccinia graminis f. sp. tritici TaxID=56615 RepID=A0A5B0PNP8_PUCGR|nr:hypothetical protein PGT21_012966 [Puccinia graminis f. sp. tritici]